MTESERNAGQVVKGGSLVLISSLLAGTIGWIWGVLASRSDIGFGAAGYGIVSMANSVIISMLAISGGLHQSFSKKISESLVTSNDIALKYSRAGFKISQLFGFAFFIPLLILSIYFFINQDSLMGSIILTISIAMYLAFFRDNFIGTLGGIQRFDLIAIVNFMSMVGGISIGFLILFLVPPPENAILALITLITGPILQLFVEFFFLKKSLPFSLKSSIFGGTDRSIVIETLKYGLYCALPMVILNGSIYTLQTLFYSLFFRPGPAIPIPALQQLSSFLFPESNIIGISAIFIGYAGVMNAVAVMAWPLVPALSEAKAISESATATEEEKSKNTLLIDDYVKSSFKTGFNLTSFFMIIYIGLSYSLLYLLHGPEYTIGYFPFIIQSVGVAFTGIVFLISAVLMGLGEGRKAAISIGTLLGTNIVLIPLFIILFKTNNPNNSLYAGPISLLLASGVILIFTFHYLTKLTRNPRSYFLSVLGKGSLSVVVAILISFFIDKYLYPYHQNILSFLLGGVIVGVIYLFTMLFLAAYDEEDLKLMEGFGPLSGFTKMARNIIRKSPFYKENEDQKTDSK